MLPSNIHKPSRKTMIRRFLLLVCLQTARGFALVSRFPTIPPARPATFLFSAGDDGEVGRGPNWIERSFPVQTEEKIDPKSVEDYNLGIDGVSFQVGPLSKRMFEVMIQRSSLPTNDADIRRALKLYAMDFTAKEAAKAALSQNGLEMVLREDEQDEGMWADIDSIRLLDDAGRDLKLYDSWEDAVDDWTPGQAFHFVARQVPAKMRELTLDELLQALDPDGSLRQQAKESGIRVQDEFSSLQDLADENMRRVETSPREAVPDKDAYAGDISKRGYSPIKAADLSYGGDQEDHATLMHVMNSLVSHGCLIVELDDEQANTMAEMWKCAESFFQADASNLPGMTTASETGSTHAKVGYANYGNMQFLETRRTRQGELLPKEALDLFPNDGKALLDAFDLVAAIGKDVVRIAVAASSVENGALQGADASQRAMKLCNELFDDNKPLVSDIQHSEGTVGMSPHRLCQYSNNNDTTKEVFGAHTDSTFITAVPVAAIAGLEVFDEEADRWYRPELAAKQHFEASGKDSELPWYTRYVVMMPGELLQLTTRSEILAAVHRVVAAKETRLSLPILLRGRPGTTLDCERYIGEPNDAILQQCNGMTIEELHDAMQPSSFQ